MAGSKLWRRLSKLKSKSRKMKGKSKAKEGNAPVETKLFGNAQIEGYDEGYLTIRDTKQNYVSYANGQEVARGDEWGFVHSTPPRQSASARGYHQVKSSVAESAQTFAAMVQQTAQAAHLLILQGKEKEERVYEHNPMVVYGHPPTRLERAMENSAALTNIVDGVQRLNFMKKAKAPHRVWDRRGKEEASQLNEAAYQEISNWTEEQVEEYNEHNLVALTTQQLKELRGKSADNITYAQPVYTVPPSTPTLDESDLDVEGEDEGEAFGRPEDDDPAAEHKYLNKDLRKLLGAYTGFHIAPATGEDMIFDRSINRSDYYGMPLIEKGHNHKQVCVLLSSLLIMFASSKSEFALA